jgi:RNA polymerase sigma-70 factor (ECF subfamily)
MSITPSRTGLSPGHSSRLTLVGSAMGPRRGLEATRSNEQWLDELHAEGQVGEAARQELRTLLVAGLARAFGGHALVEVEDFAQEAMLRVLQRLDSFRGDSHFTTWAMSTAARVAWSELRRARWKDVSFEALVAIGGEEEMKLESPDDGDRAVARGRALAVLEDAIHRLTERQRTVIAAELRGMPQDEIGRRLGITRNAVYKLGHDARRALLRILVAEGFTAEDIQWMFDAGTRIAP